jgi:hypothetical protein
MRTAVNEAWSRFESLISGDAITEDEVTSGDVTPLFTPAAHWDRTTYRFYS